MRQVLQSVTDCYYKVCQVLQSMTGCYDKVRQVLQSVTVITKWAVTHYSQSFGYKLLKFSEYSLMNPFLLCPDSNSLDIFLLSTFKKEMLHECFRKTYYFYILDIFYIFYILNCFDFKKKLRREGYVLFQYLQIFEIWKNTALLLLCLYQIIVCSVNSFYWRKTTNKETEESIDKSILSNNK